MKLKLNKEKSLKLNNEKKSLKLNKAELEAQKGKEELEAQKEELALKHEREMRDLELNARRITFQESIATKFDLGKNV